jgi:2-phospho-L-lactate guanylyltransferase
MNVLIPVKSLEHAKSRLNDSLSPDERKHLVLQMLDHVIDIVQSCKEITKITIVTPDEEIKNHVQKREISVLSEEKPGYNESLTKAAAHEKGNALLTIAADLPLLTTDDINHLLQLAKSHDIVLAPAKDGGTNAVFMKFALILPYLFGEHSFEYYKKTAQEKKLSVGIYQSETIAFDIDTEEDLKKFKEMK